MQRIYFTNTRVIASERLNASDVPLDIGLIRFYVIVF